MKKEQDASWDTNENIVTHFLKVEKALKQLEQAKVKCDKTELLSNALFTIKESGKMEQAIIDWDKKLLQIKLGRI